MIQQKHEGQKHGTWRWRMVGLRVEDAQCKGQVHMPSDNGIIRGSGCQGLHYTVG